MLTGALVIVFASTYFYFGSPHNFVAPFGSPSMTGRLTHLDALSLAVGTLTTAGSADLPRSQWARGLVTTQELVDLVLFGFIAVIAIGRFRLPRSIGKAPAGGDPGPEPSFPVPGRAVGPTSGPRRWSVRYSGDPELTALKPGLVDTGRDAVGPHAGSGKRPRGPGSPTPFSTAGTPKPLI